MNNDSATRRETAELRKCKATQKACDNVLKTVKKAKLVKINVGRSKFIHSSNMENELTPEPLNNVSPIVPPFKDVSQYKFTLS